MFRRLSPSLSVLLATFPCHEPCVGFTANEPCMENFCVSPISSAVPPAVAGIASL
jgi:hypothetical protein